MIGIPFQGVGGESISVQDLISDPLGQGLAGATMVGLAANSDQLAYWDPSISGNYVYLYLCNNKTAKDKSGTAKYNKWCVMTASKNLTDDAKAKWGDYDQVCKAKLDPGVGLWFKRKAYTATKSITMAGQVVVAQTGVNVTLNPGFNMFSGGFTTPFAPNVVDAGAGTKDVDWLGKGVLGATMVGLAANADQLAYWDPTISGNYVYLYLCNNKTAKDKSGKAKYNKWCVMTASKNLTDEAKAMWGDYDQVSPARVPAGRGVWFKRKASASTLTLTLDQPYSL